MARYFTKRSVVRALDAGRTSRADWLATCSMRRFARWQDANPQHGPTRRAHATGSGRGFGF